MPAMVIGMSSSMGFFAKRVPRVTFGAAGLAVAFQRVARLTEAPRNSRSSKCGTRRFAPPPRMS
jgi:hypothetical protein